MIRGRWAFAAAGMLVVIAVALVIAYHSLNRFQDRGDLPVAGLSEPVEVLRDRRGMPYLFAANRRDAMLAQGFITAQHRLFQLDFYRRLINGRLAELLGSDALESDRYLRTLNIAENAAGHWQRLQPADRVALQAYADGINAYVDDYRHEHHLEFRLLGTQPSRWKPQDLLAIAHYVASTQSQSLDSALVLRRMLDSVGADRVRALFPFLDESLPREVDTSRPIATGMRGAVDNRSMPGSLPGLGSNAWALSPSRTASGAPVLANDPHLNARTLPGVWHPIGLHTPDAHAVGAAIPGLPGLLVGRNERFAFGVTNAYGDTQDLYIEQVDPENPDRYRDGDRWRRFHRREETIRIRDPSAGNGYRTEALVVRETVRGPVITDLPSADAGGRVMSLRWTAADPQAQGSRLGFDRLWLARDEGELLEAINDIGLLTFHMVHAHVDGDIGARATGRIPVRANRGGTLPAVVRSRDNWIGWIPPDWMPAERNPPDGWVAAANHDTRADYYPFRYAEFFAPRYRRDRLVDLLDQGDQLDTARQWATMLDTRNRQAEALRPHIVAAMDRIQARGNGDDLLAEARTLLHDWDLHDRAGSPAPLIYHRIYKDLARTVFTEGLGTALAGELLPLGYLWKESLDDLVARRRLAELPGLSGSAADALVERVVLSSLRRLEREHGAEPAQWRWGEAHRILFTSPLRPAGVGRDWLGGGDHALDGSGETLLRAAYGFSGEGHAVRLHDSLRFLADLGDPHRVRASLAGGVVGRQFHPNFRDGLPAWLDGAAEDWWFSEQRIREHATARAWLRPVEEGR